MNYVSLTAPKNTPGSLADFLNNSTLTASAPFIIQEAESEIYRRLRHWRMLTPPVTGTLTVGNDFIPIPADCLEPDIFMLTGTQQSWLDQKPIQEVMRRWSYDDAGVRTQQQPVIYSFNQTNLVFDSVADQAYPYALVYYQQPAALSASNPTNFLTDVYPRMLRCAMMMQATEWAKDSGVGQFDRTYWMQLLVEQIATAQAESDRARRAVISGEAFIGGGSGGAPVYSW
jgi:hypothetical protein